MSQLLYVLRHKGRISESLAGSDATVGPYYSTEVKEFALRFSERVEGSSQEVFPNLKSISAVVGLLDRRPNGGATKLKIGPSAATAANTTVAIPYNASALVVQAAINALAAVVAVYGAATVSQITGGYSITFANATAAVPIQALENRLVPVAFVRVKAWEASGEWIHEIRYVQTPLTASSDFERVNPPAPTVTTIRDGGVDPSSTYNWTEIQQLHVPPKFRGEYVLRYGYAKTSVLSIADGAEEIQTAINTMLAGEYRATVTNSSDNNARIEFFPAGLNVDQLTVDIVSAPIGDATLKLDFRKAAVGVALREKQTLQCYFEVVGMIAEDGAEAEDPGLPEVLFRTSVELRRGVFSAEDGATSDVDWLRPVSPRNYVPFSRTQTITGQQHFVAIMGDDDATAFTIDHNLGTDSISGLIVRENVSGGRVLRDSEYTVEIDSDDSLTITFPAAPEEDAYVVIITSAGPTSRFVEDIEIEIEQVIGLSDLLDDLGTRVEILEAVLPTTGPAGAANTTGPSVEIDLAPISEVIGYKGTASPFGQKGIDTGLLPLRSAPALLPAIHDATAASNDFDPLPDPASFSGQLLSNTGVAVILPGFARLPSSTLGAGGLAGCDGRGFYPVRRDATSNSYFPIAMERQLFMVAINSEQLRVNRTLEIQFALGLALVNADIAAQWEIVIEVGTLDADTSPSPIGLNLSAITWATTTPILSHRMILGPALVRHSFGCRIKREVSELLADKLLYGTWLSASGAAPASANFAVRARLKNFDVENVSARGRGWVAYQLLAPLSASSSESTPATPAAPTAKIF